MSRSNSFSSTTSSSTKPSLVRDLSIDNLLTIEDKFTRQSINQKKQSSSFNNNGIYYFPNGEIFKPRSTNHQKRSKPEKLKNRDNFYPRNGSNLITASSSVPVPVPVSIKRSSSNPNFNHFNRSIQNSNFNYLPPEFKKKLTKPNNIIKSNSVQNLSYHYSPKEFPRSNSIQNLSLQSLPENKGFSSLSSTSSTASSSSSVSISEMNSQSIDKIKDNIQNNVIKEEKEDRLDINRKITPKSVEKLLGENHSESDINKDISHHALDKSILTQPLQQIEADVISLSHSQLNANSTSLIRSTNEINSTTCSKLDSVSSKIHSQNHVLATEQSLDNYEKSDETETSSSHQKVESESPTNSFISSNQCLIQNQNSDDKLSNSESDCVDDTLVNTSTSVFETDQKTNSIEKSPIKNNNTTRIVNSSQFQKDVVKFSKDSAFTAEVNTNEVNDNTTNDIPGDTNAAAEVAKSLASSDSNDKNQDTLYTVNSSLEDKSVNLVDKESRSNNILGKEEIVDDNQDDVNLNETYTDDVIQTAEEEIPPRRDLIRRHHSLRIERENPEIPLRGDLIRRHHSMIFENPDIPLRRDLESGSIRSYRRSGIYDFRKKSSSNSLIDDLGGNVLMAPHELNTQPIHKRINDLDNIKSKIDTTIESSIRSTLTNTRLSSNPVPVSQTNKQVKKHISLPRIGISAEKAQSSTKPPSGFKLFFKKLFSRDSSKSSNSLKSNDIAIKTTIGNKRKQESKSWTKGEGSKLVNTNDKAKKANIIPLVEETELDKPTNLNSEGEPVSKSTSSNSYLKTPEKTVLKNDESLTLTRLPSISTASIKLMDDFMDTINTIDQEIPKPDGFLELDLYDSTGHLKSNGVRNVHRDIFLKDDELSVDQIKDQQIKDSNINAGSSSTSLNDEYIDDNIRFLQNEFNWREYDSNRFSVSQLDNSDSETEEIDYSTMFSSQNLEGNCEVFVINQDQLVKVFSKLHERERVPSPIKYIKQFQDFKSVKVEYRQFEDSPSSIKSESNNTNVNSIIKTKKAEVKKLVLFSNNISINQTFAPDMYKRYNKSVTQYTLTEPSEIMKIKVEMNNYKSNEMLVHEHSRNNTHFFYS